jgi:hypothetical protein
MEIEDSMRLVEESVVDHMYCMEVEQDTDFDASMENEDFVRLVEESVVEDAEIAKMLMGLDLTVKDMVEVLDYDFLHLMFGVYQAYATANSLSVPVLECNHVEDF